MLIKPTAANVSNKSNSSGPRRRTGKSASSKAATMTIAFAVLSSRRAAVRALSSRAWPGLAGPGCRAAGAYHGHAGFRHTVLEAARQPTNRAAFSTAADHDTDRELEEALDELLGDAVKEAENPLLEGALAKGHVQGSREFPKELLEVQSILHESFTKIALVAFRVDGAIPVLSSVVLAVVPDLIDTALESVFVSDNRFWSGCNAQPMDLRSVTVFKISTVREFS
eukprot:CCRYP_006934-RA/>CCRYP_006934-RA protein AED:0.03 eAED:0.03 QI:361/1/1/1/0.75/0.2/5/3027/224